MSNLSTMNPPVKDSKFLQKQVWIGILNKERSLDVDKTEAYKEYERVRDLMDTQGTDGRKRPKLMPKDEFEKARRKTLDDKLDLLDFKLGMVTMLCDKPTRERMKDLVEKAKAAARKDLSNVKINEEANESVSVAIREMDKALNGVSQGLGTFAKELVDFVASDLYQDAYAIEGTLGREFIAVAQTANTDTKKAAQDLNALKEKCQRVKDGMAKKEQDQKDLRDRADKLHKGDYKTALENPKAEKETKGRLTTLMTSADKYIDECIDKPDRVQKAKDALDEIEAVVDQLTKDPKGLEDASKFKKHFDYIQEFYNDAAKFNNSPACKSPVSDLQAHHGDVVGRNTVKNYGEVAQGLAARLREKIATLLAEARSAWKTELKKASPSIKLAQRVSKANAEQEENVDLEDKRTNAQKQAYTSATAALDKYEAAQDHATKLEYTDALTDLADAVRLAAPLKQVADQAMKDVLEDTEKAAEEEKRVFGPLALGKEGFNTNKDALTFMSGQTRDERGGLEPSEQMEEMFRIEKAALDRWHKMVDAGIDPVSAGEKAFANIPQNFWPAEAVRVVAMFRRAEATFEEEERVKELEQELASKKLTPGKVLDKAEVLNNSETKKFVLEATESFGQVTLEVLKEGYLKQLEELHKDWSPQQLSEAALKQAKETDLGKVAESMGFLAGGLKVISGMFNVGMDIKDLHDKQTAIDKEELDPVKLKMAEFERNRAIMHLVLDIADTVLNVGGPLNEVVPGLGLGSDAFTAAKSIAEAGRYFDMLRQTKQIKKGAKRDPETMMHLALANECDEMLWSGIEKAYEVATALIKVAGGIGEVAGPAAPAGFAVKKAGLVLEYCGKAFFTIKEWVNASTYKKTIAKARAVPVDYVAVELVFKECRVYARFALAWGCVEGNDPWARQYVLSRGLTDADLDNPETSASIVREYLNVTFEGLMGDTQEEEAPETFTEWLGIGKKKKKEGTGQPFRGTWEASDFSLGKAAWLDNCKNADNLFLDKKAHAVIATGLESYTKSLSGLQSAHEKYKKAFAKVELKAASEKDLKEYEEARTKLRTCADDLDAELRALHGDISRYEPLTSDKKQPHQTMEEYLDALLLRIADGTQEVLELHAELSTDEFRAGADSEDKVIEKARKKFEEAEKSTVESEKKRKQEIQTAWNKTFDEYMFKMPWGDTCLLKFVGRSALEKLSLNVTPIRMGKIIEQQAQQFSLGSLMILYSPQSGHLAPEPPNATPKVKEKFAKQQQKALEKNIKTQMARCAKQLESYILDQVSEFKAKDDPNAYTFTLKNPSELNPKIWNENKKTAEENGWCRGKTGINEAMTKFVEADEAWKLVKGDIHLQGEWRGRMAVLAKAVTDWKPAVKDLNIKHPTMSRYRTALLQAIADARIDFANEVQTAEKPTSGEDWSPTTAELANWPISAAGWENMQSMAVQHGWKNSHPKHMSTAFSLFDKAKNDNEKKTALDKIIKRLGEFKDSDYVYKEDKKRPFVGMKNWVDGTLGRVQQLRSAIK